ncbi:MAG: hypothetical protein Q9182_001834 [Xanthomendoza sp. 2 TL-2023]
MRFASICVGANDLQGRIGLYTTDVAKWRVEGERWWPQDMIPESFVLKPHPDVETFAQDLESHISTDFKDIAFEEIVRFALKQASYPIEYLLKRAGIAKRELQSKCKDDCHALNVHKAFSKVCPLPDLWFFGLTLFFKASQQLHPVTRWILDLPTNPISLEQQGAQVNAVLYDYIWTKCTPRIIEAFRNSESGSDSLIILHGILWDRTLRTAQNPDWYAPFAIDWDLLSLLYKDLESAAIWLCDQDHQIRQRSSCMNFINMESWWKSSISKRWLGLLESVESFFRISDTKLWDSLYTFIPFLRVYRNFFSLSAVLHGVLAAGTTRSGRESLYADMSWGADTFVGLTDGGNFINHPRIAFEQCLIVETNNFDAYRQNWSATIPGLPFFKPHIVNVGGNPKAQIAAVRSEDMIYCNPLWAMLSYGEWLQRKAGIDPKRIFRHTDGQWAVKSSSVVPKVSHPLWAHVTNLTLVRNCIGIRL